MAQIQSQTRIGSLYIFWGQSQGNLFLCLGNRAREGCFVYVPGQNYGVIFYVGPWARGEGYFLYDLESELDKDTQFMHFPGPELRKDIFISRNQSQRRLFCVWPRVTFREGYIFYYVLRSPLMKNIFVCPGTTAGEGCVLQVLGPEFGKGMLCITWSPIYRRIYFVSLGARARKGYFCNSCTYRSCLLKDAPQIVLKRENSHLNFKLHHLS